MSTMVQSGLEDRTKQKNMYKPKVYVVLDGGSAATQK